MLWWVREPKPPPAQQEVKRQSLKRIHQETGAMSLFLSCVEVTAIKTKSENCSFQAVALVAEKGGAGAGHSITLSEPCDFYLNLISKSARAHTA